MNVPSPDLSIQPAGILNSLTTLSRALAGTDGFGNVARRGLEILERHYGVARAAVLLCEEESREKFRAAASIGLSSRKRKLLQGLRYKAGQETMLQAAVTGRDFIAPAAGAEEPLYFLCLPLHDQQGETIGVLSLEAVCPPEQKPQSLLELFRVVASMLAQAFTVNQLVEATTRQMLDENANLRAELSERYDFSRILGNSSAMRQIYEQIAQVACTGATVLITGESGTGKELVAHALHVNSPRANRPFIKVNCAALPESLIETELFGHERGAFTDAIAAKPGRFEIAEGGTLFLDEIGELSINAQIKLLRVLQEREFERVGGTITLKADVRVIAATNRNLDEEMAAGRFRADLFYRLNMFTITTPPLRERREDVALLADSMLKKHARENRRPVCRLTSPALKLLEAYGWPGNVRELENALERAVVVAGDSLIHPHHLPPAVQTIEPAANGDLNLFESVEAYERELIREALRNTRGNRNQASKRLRISERVLSYKVKKYAIDCDEFRA
ncbi:MAG: sigma-54-dependent Fis family transcriptional regulator [Blastocatellia bacterium]